MVYDADGKKYYINKSDLADVIRESMAEANVNSKGLMPSNRVRGIVTSNVGVAIDFNNYSGITPALLRGANSPSGDTSEWFVLDQYISGSFTIQRTFSYTSGIERKRIKRNDAWDVWAVV